MATNRSIPFKATHPGYILKEELKERGIKQNEFSKTIGVAPSNLNEVIKGKRNVTPELALKLEKHLDVPSGLWLRLQSQYECDLIRIAERDKEEVAARAYEKECGEFVLLPKLCKALGIEAERATDRIKQLELLFDFPLSESFQVERSTLGLYRKSDKRLTDEKAMRTWQLIVYAKARQMPLPSVSYQNGNGMVAAQRIAALANKQSLTIERIKSVLAEAGIMYLEVEKLNKAPIDAYSRLLHNGVPLIAVTYRFNDMDKLAFDILHEICHIEKHLSKVDEAFISLDGSEYSNDPKEIEANTFARDMLIPPAMWKAILKNETDSLAVHHVINLLAKNAEKHGISQSIAVARYKHDNDFYRTKVYQSPKIKEKP